MILFDFSMIVVAYLIWEKLSKEKDHQKLIDITNTLIKAAATIQVLNTIIYIYSRQKLY